VPGDRVRQRGRALLSPFARETVSRGEDKVLRSGNHLRHKLPAQNGNHLQGSQGEDMLIKKAITVALLI
jgi:hypothetical protein